MNKLTGLIVFLALAVNGFSQTFTPYEDQKIKFGLNIGLNTSKFRADSLEFESVMLPFAGINVNLLANPRVNFRLSANYSLRGSDVFDPYYKFRYQYLDAQLSAQFLLSENFRMELGFQPSVVISSKAIYGSDKTDFILLPGDQYRQEYQLFGGLEIRLQEFFLLGFKYFYPLKNSSFNNFSVYLNIPLKPEYFSYKPDNKEEIAFQMIKELKDNGTILVRLKTSENKIKAYEDAGQFEEAEKQKQVQMQENLDIVAGFRKYFSFCPVEFFFSNNTDQIMNSKLKGALLNDKLEVDSQIQIKSDVYYIAEFGGLELEADDQNQTIGTSVEALILKNKDLKQLTRPFPYFVRKNEFMMEARKTDEMIKLLNYNLQEYYSISKLQK